MEADESACERETLPGNVTAVERVGQTVRRAMQPDAVDRVHRVLRHLERVGFGGAPRLVDVGVEESVEILSYVPGWVPAYEEKGRIGLAGLRSLGALLRGLDDALDSLDAPAPGSDELRWRHGDASLGNCVFDAGGDQAIAFIDFDYARPLPSWWDFHRCAWQSAPLADSESLVAMGVAPGDVLTRLAAYVSGYAPPAEWIVGFSGRVAECVQEFLDNWQGGDDVVLIVERQLHWIKANAEAIDATAAAAGPPRHFWRT